MELTQATSKTCRACLESNLTEDIKLARCAKCNSVYCIHFASKLDPSQCVECLADVSLYKEVITKSYIHESYNEETDTVTTTEYKRKARSIRLEGMDWLFAQRKIHTLTDESLELAIEYHREILSGMLAEREQRRAEYRHRYAGVKEVPSPSGSVDKSLQTNTTVKRTRTISSTKAAATADSILQSMLAGGADISKIMEMLEKASKGGVKNG